MSTDEEVRLRTTVRFKRSKLWALLLILPLTALLLIGVKFGIFVFLLPAPFLLLRWNQTAEASVVASAEGLRINERFVPRAAFTSGLVRHDEDGRVFVALDGRERIDIAVTSNVPPTRY